MEALQPMSACHKHSNALLTRGAVVCPAMQENLGCGIIANYFTAYPNEYYDKFDYSASQVPMRLFSWVLGNASFDSLRMNMLFLLFLGPVCEEAHGSTRLLSMFIVTAVTGGIYTLCFANGAMIGADALVYVLIAMSAFNVYNRWSTEEAKNAAMSKAGGNGSNAANKKFPFTAIIGCSLFIGSQAKVLIDELNDDLEDGVSQAGHMFAGLIGTLSWVLLHKRKRIMKWAQVSPPQPPGQLGAVDGRWI
jgi:membrane associated rhomboid family serine protease